MRLIQLSLLLGLLGFISLNSYAQCSQKLSDLPAAPELFGFRIGMTNLEVKALVPQVKFGKKDDFGVSKTTINPSFDPTIDESRFPSVRSISLDFLDDRLSSIWIGFDETYKVQSISEFTQRISESLKLPVAWTTYKIRGQQIRCDGFQIIVTPVGGGPSLRILDSEADDTIAQRRHEKEERDAAVETAATNETEVEEIPITADKKTKTYYPAGCEPDNEISIDSRVIFKNLQEAEKAGFKIAKKCQ